MVEISKRGYGSSYFFERRIYEIYSTIYGYTYKCDHPVYNKCTLFKINNKGLAVIQQRYIHSDKTTYWDNIDPWLIDELYLHEKFELFFYDRAGEPQNGLYPTVTIRQIMWGLKMKPLRKQQWETCFDRRLI